MDKAELKRRWKAHVAGVRRAEEFVIEERRKSTPDERMRQAEIWFCLARGLGTEDDKQEEEVRKIWARLHRAWAARAHTQKRAP